MAANNRTLSYLLAGHSVVSLFGSSGTKLAVSAGDNTTYKTHSVSRFLQRTADKPILVNMWGFTWSVRVLCRNRHVQLDGLLHFYTLFQLMKAPHQQPLKSPRAQNNPFVLAIVWCQLCYQGVVTRGLKDCKSSKSQARRNCNHLLCISALTSAIRFLVVSTLSWNSVTNGVPASMSSADDMGGGGSIS